MNRNVSMNSCRAICTMVCCCHARNGHAWFAQKGPGLTRPGKARKSSGRGCMTHSLPL